MLKAPCIIWRPKAFIGFTRPTWRFQHTNSQNNVPLWRRARFMLLTTTGIAGTLLFVAYALDSRAAVHRYVVTPLLNRFMDPEKAHRAAIWILKSGLAPRENIWKNIFVTEKQDEIDDVLGVEVSNFD